MRERKGEREIKRKGERNIDVREKHRLVASRMHLDQGSDLQPMYVRRPGIEPVTSLVYEAMLQPDEPLSQGRKLLSKNFMKS